VVVDKQYSKYIVSLVNNRGSFGGLETPWAAASELGHQWFAEFGAELLLSSQGAQSIDS